METIIHDVSSIELGEVEVQSTYCHRLITVRTGDGQELELSLFAHEKEALEIEIKSTQSQKI